VQKKYYHGKISRAILVPLDYKIWSDEIGCLPARVLATAAELVKLANMKLIE